MSRATRRSSRKRAAAATYQELYPLYRKLYFAFGQRQSERDRDWRRAAGAAPNRGAGARRPECWKRCELKFCEANLELVRRGLVLYTFGNASGVSREHGLVVIKPSGVPYEKMTPADMVITDLDGRVVEGIAAAVLRSGTHSALYRAFPVDRRRRAHAFAPRHRLGAGRPRDSLLRHHPRGLLSRSGAGDRARLRADEIESDYEANTGVAIIRLHGGPRSAGLSRGAGGRTRAVLLGEDR